MSGEVRLPAGDGKEAFIDAEDIAEAAVNALIESGHAGWCYELSGTRLMSFADAVAEIARATDRGIRYVPLTPEAYAARRRASAWRRAPPRWRRPSSRPWRRPPLSSRVRPSLQPISFAHDPPHGSHKIPQALSRSGYRS
ncbi:hypothetical protein ACFYO0_27250 [Streptomyces sp. NPDC006365]|uniref:hypothetical protein n=1 Tax=Streptomyces sp. NPDC006365 TaxID=3364744 RepID=UPI0036835784